MRRASLRARPLGAALLLIAEASACTMRVSAPDVPRLPCDVEQVLVDKCQRCHSNPPAPGVPIPLVTYEDTQVPFPAQNNEPVWQVIGDVIELDAMPVQPPFLTAGERGTLLAWVDAGAPPADGGCD
jgi:hypothetical protein